MHVQVENFQENLEAFKRKHLRQNREIIRLNMLQSVKVRQLEMETGRLLQENFELRASLISLQEQHEKEKKNIQFKKLELLKKTLENKLSEISNIIQNILPESSLELSPMQRDRDEKKKEKIHNSILPINPIHQEICLSEKSKKTSGTKKIEKNNKKNLSKSLNDKQTSTDFINDSIQICNDNDSSSSKVSVDTEDSSFTYIEKKTFDFKDKNIESKWKEKKALERKENSQITEKNDTSDDFIFTRAKTNTKNKKQLDQFLEAFQYEKIIDKNVEKENVINFELYLKEKDTDNNSVEKSPRISETNIRKVLESKPSIANKKVETLNDWKTSQKIKTETPHFLHVSEVTSPEKRVGRTKKTINYALPSLKTKMRRDDTLIEDINSSKGYSKKKNISENQLENTAKESHEKLSAKQERNTDVSISSHTKCEKTPSVVIQKTLSTKCDSSKLSENTQKNQKSEFQYVLKSPIKFSEKTTEDYDSMFSSDEELNKNISCMNKRETNNDNAKSESFEKDKRRRTVHELLKTGNSIFYISEYKNIQNENEMFTRRKSMLA